MTNPQSICYLQLAIEKICVYIGLQLTSSKKEDRRRLIYTHFSHHTTSRVSLYFTYTETGQDINIYTKTLIDFCDFAKVYET